MSSSIDYWTPEYRTYIENFGKWLKTGCKGSFGKAPKKQYVDGYTPPPAYNYPKAQPSINCGRADTYKRDEIVIRISLE